MLQVPKTTHPAIRMMSTIANLQLLSGPKLRELLLAQDGKPNNLTKLAIIDVRDDDHIGGHIKGSTHIPSASLDAILPTLLRKLEDVDTVVFHCALSQQRGPGAALRYIRAREAMSEKPAQKAGAGETAAKEPQKVYVLDRGFVGWQEEYGEDERLTEGYVKDLWKDGW